MRALVCVMGVVVRACADVAMLAVSGSSCVCMVSRAD